MLNETNKTVLILPKQYEQEITFQSAGITISRLCLLLLRSNFMQFCYVSHQILYRLNIDNLWNKKKKYYISIPNLYPINMIYKWSIAVS